MKRFYIFGLGLCMFLITPEKLFSQERNSTSDSIWIYDFQSETDSTFQRRQLIAVYDSSNIRETYVLFSNQLNGDWEMGGKFWIRCNPQRLTEKSIQYNWNMDLQQWEEYELDEHFPDRWGNDTLWYISHKNGSGDWFSEEGYRWENSYNEQDQLEESIRFMGYPGQESLYSKSEYAYDTAGNRILELYYVYQTDWVLTDSTEFTFDSESREVEELLYLRTGDELVKYSWIIHEYDTAGNNTVLEQYSWEVDPGEWRMWYREDKSYDPQGKLMERVVQKSYCCGVPQPWVTIRYRDEYDLSGKLSLTEISELEEGSGLYVLTQKEFHRSGGDYFILCDSICTGETYFWQGENIESEGTYRKEYGSAMGLDSIYTLYLKENEAPTSFVISGPPSVALEQEVFYIAEPNEGVDYSWAVQNGSVLSGAENDTLGVRWETSGTGEVAAWALNEYGCSSDTITLQVLVGETGTDDLSAEGIRVYPVPVKKLLHVESNLDFQEIHVLDLAGRIVAMTTGSSIDLSQLPDGTYVIILKESNGKVTGIRKIIKK